MAALETLRLKASHWESMRAQVERHAPLEACGLVAGRGSRAARVIPVENALRSPVRFRMEPAQQLAAFNEMEQDGLDLLAIYHSHPAGPAVPSATDIAEAFYPEATHLIWSRRGSEWSCRGFRIEDKMVQEIQVVIEAENADSTEK